MEKATLARSIPCAPSDPTHVASIAARARASRADCRPE
jgi:hypothetical protein